MSRFATRIKATLSRFFIAPLGLALLCSSLYAGELLSAADQLRPNENGLPPPLPKPLNLSVCFFDMQGKNGDFYSRAKDLALIAQRWNVIADIKVFTDERVAADNFKAGRCDAAGISTMRARQFNLFMGSIEAVGAVTNYEQLRLLLRTLLDPKIVPLTITEPYQILGVLPVGGTYIHVKDRAISSIEKAAGKKIAVLDWDKSQTEIVNKIGAHPVPSNLSNFASQFNNGQVDIIVAPALVFRPFELSRGLGENGGIYRLPLTQMTASFVINRDRIKKQLPDLDEKLVAFRAIADQFVDQILNQTYAWIDKAEADIPSRYWLAIDPQNEKKYAEMLRTARIEMTKQGYYDPKMIELLKRIRCKLAPENAECTQTDE
ncbi:MAG: hypothetical protein H6996_06595 [Moraxellaceae bacterium]|nr:hypothetical protein [Pseudomonadales bacterium]MCP5174753.1 hypothetical protein [Moraxellaceae bacterium]MCP5176560.1 hypothetical protein [Moraxellaceae bacterium]